MLRVLLILVILCLFHCCVAQDPARSQFTATRPASIISRAASNDGLLLPVALGFLLKIVLVVLGGMVKLLFLGFTSLGVSGVALLLGVLFLKNNGLVIAPHQPPAGWHERGDWHPYRQKRIGYGYNYGGGYHRNGKNIKQAVDFYKPQVGAHKSVYPVPVSTAIDPRRYQVDGDDVPHHENKSQLQEQWTPKMMVKDTESAPVANGNTDTFEKRANELPQTHTY